MESKSCPVCGGRPKKVPDDYSCPFCGQKLAFVDRFANARLKMIWDGNNAVKKNELEDSLRYYVGRSRMFRLQDGSLTFCAGNHMMRFTSEGVEKMPEGIVDYDTAENATQNQVYLMSNGKVRAEGDNEFCQCIGVQEFSDISDIVATAQCTYARTINGDVKFCGKPVSQEISSWKEIYEISVGLYHILGLTYDGHVLAAGSLLRSEFVREISTWRDIIKVVSAGDAAIGLTSEGRVCFAGKENDPRAEARKWEDIVIIAMESAYAVGLTREGKILLAGKCRNEYLDMGRKDAVNWNDVIAISCTHSGIAGMKKDGGVYLAGNIRNIRGLQEQWNNNREMVYEKLMQYYRDRNKVDVIKHA